MFDSDGESVGYRDYDYSSANVRAVPSPASFFNVHKGFRLIRRLIAVCKAGYMIFSPYGRSISYHFRTT